MELRYNWDAINDELVCRSQNLAIPALTTVSANINGILNIPLPEGDIVSFSALGYVRTIQIHITVTDGSLSGIIMTVSGAQYNGPASLIVGPDDWTDWTSDTGSIVIESIPFSVVNAIKFENTNEAGSVSFTLKVGSGYSGYFNAIDVVNNINSASHIYNLSFESNGCTYTIYESLSLTLDGTYDHLISSNVFMKPDSVLVNPSNQTALLQLRDVCSYLLVAVTSSDSDSRLRLNSLLLS